MAKKRKPMAKKRKKNNNHSFLIVIGLFIVVLIIIAIAILSKDNTADPGATQSADPGVSALASATPTVAPSGNIGPTATVSASDMPTTPTESLQPTQSPEPIPSIQQTELSIPSNKVFVIHLTVDSGEMNPSDEQLFDDDLYFIPTEEPDEYDYSSTKVLVLVTDHRGNSRIARYDAPSISLKINRNTPSGMLSDEDALSQLSIRIDGAQNLHLTWAGETKRITAEGTDDSSITATHGGKELTVSARPIGLRNKSDYQQ